MNEDFEKDVKKTLDQSITAFNCKIERLLDRYKAKANAVKVGKSIRYLFYDRDTGFMKVQFKLEYTPEEIAFLEKTKSLSQKNRKLVEAYIEELSKK